MLLHLLPLSSCPSLPAPPFRSSAGAGLRLRAGGRARRRALRETDLQPETPPRGRRGREEHAAGSGKDDGALLESVKRLLLADEAEGDAAESEEQGQFPKRWAIVFLCFSAFLLCNMDRVRAASAYSSAFSLHITWASVNALYMLLA